MRQLDLVDIEFDFQDDVAFHRGRMGDRSAADARRSNAQVPLAAGPDDAALLEAIPERLEAVAQSKGPVHLAVLGQLLRRHLPQLTAGWAGAPTLAAFLHQLNIEPLQRAMLDNSTTAVLYDPARHEPPTGMVGDRLVIGMLRAAELPEMRGADLVRILAAAQTHMGATESFEIAESAAA